MTARRVVTLSLGENDRVTQVVVDAIRQGDVEAVRRYLHELPHEALWGDEGRALAVEVVRSGGPGLAQQLYGYGEALPSGPWDGLDPLVWAADHGASALVRGLIGRNPETGLRAALDAARAWLGADPEAELRRRTGPADGDAFTVTRDLVVIDEHEPRARRIRVTTAAGRWAEVLTEHRAVVTILEPHLELPVSRDELLARALWSVDPGSCDWSESQRAIRARFEREGTIRWAAARLADDDTSVRRFTSELLLVAAYEEEAVAGVRAVLRTRTAAEPDTETLCNVIGAFAGASDAHAVLDELLPFASDPRPEVRRRVAIDLFDHADHRTDLFLATTLRLARDPDPTVRKAATAGLVHSSVDAPALRELFAAQLDDADREVRIDAATGLARRGDANAVAHLRRMSDEDGPDSYAWIRCDWVRRTTGHGDGRRPPDEHHTRRAS